MAGGEFNKVVNEPADRSIITLGNGKDGHSFIAEYHRFYNNTLGWGRIDHANHAEQIETAEEILAHMEGAIINNPEIAEDFEQIKKYAHTVLKKDDRKAMRMLHRLFHDLDIYLNGYDYHQTFGVTKYRGEND